MPLGEGCPEHRTLSGSSTLLGPLEKGAEGTLRFWWENLSPLGPVHPPFFPVTWSHNPQYGHIKCRTKLSSLVENYEILKKLIVFWLAYEYVSFIVMVSWRQILILAFMYPPPSPWSPSSPPSGLLPLFRHITDAPLSSSVSPPSVYICLLL